MTPFKLKNNHIKKAYIQTLNIPMINHIKKAYFQNSKCFYNPFYTNNFFKSNNIYKKHTCKPQTSL